MLQLIKDFFDPGKKILKQFEDKPAEVRKHIERYSDKSDEELQRIIQAYKEELKDLVEKVPEEFRGNIRMRRKVEGLSQSEIELYDKIQKIMPSVYAILSIATDRTVQKMHYDVQLLAGAVLASGQKLVEMKTGEGKTLTFHLPLFLYGLTGRGAHLVTVNDYLAKRDGEYAGHIFSRLGVSVGVVASSGSFKFVPDDELRKTKGDEAVKERKQIKEIALSEMRGVNLIECEKKDAYECDIVYGTNNEFGFDYLRDNMVKSMNRRSQRELYFCIVDEADSILIDEARTPLIISAPAAESNDLYRTFARIVPKLKKDKHFVVEEKERSVNLTDEGIAEMEKYLDVSNIWEDYRLAHHLENALKSLVFYRKDKEYLVRDGEVMIVDEFTGRVLAGRRYSEGLHQAIEAKEGVAIQQESRTLATITFQNFFRLYKILTGGSGTIMTEQEEFFKIYNLESTAIPTNKPLARKDQSDRIYKTPDAKFNAVAEEIASAHESGQPILVGTTSISDSETVSRLLEKKKIEHEVLNAKYHEREAQIVANAGEVGAVTVATNMAGRGTDIPLGKGAKEAGGLYVIGTERHESRRIDNQLRGRSGRQGDPGASRFFVSLEDQIMRIQGGDVIKRIMDMTNIPDELPIESGMVTKSIERAQKRMEGMYFDSRKHVVEYDDVVNQQREIFYRRRFRYLQLADKFNDLAGKDKDDKKIKQSLSETRAKLVKEFEEIVDELSQKYAFAAVTDGGKEKEERLSELVNELLSLGNDQIFVSAANNMKLYKKEIKTVDDLQNVLTEQINDRLSDQEKLTKFFESFLKRTIEIKLESTKNISGLVRIIFLDVMDEMWTLHLDYMQDVREGIGLRGVAQRDPLVEYKNEGFQAFADFISKVNNRALQGLLQVVEFTSPAPVNEAQQIQTNAAQIADVLTGTREIDMTSGKVSRKPQKQAKQLKVGRNDACPCGSGKKFKKCGIKNTPEHIANMQKKFA